jgi:hypothetical protein
MPSTAQTEIVPVYRSLAQFARRFPWNKESRPVHVATLTRWILKGCRASAGTRIKLRATRFPAGWRTTDEWVAEFLDALTADRAGLAAPAPSSRAPDRRRRDIERAERELAAAGF